MPGPEQRPGILFQVIDSGPGLKGRDYKLLFDPAHDTGTTPLDWCKCSCKCRD